MKYGIQFLKIKCSQHPDQYMVWYERFIYKPENVTMHAFASAAPACSSWLFLKKGRATARASPRES